MFEHLNSCMFVTCKGPRLVKLILVFLEVCPAGWLNIKSKLLVGLGIPIESQQSLLAYQGQVFRCFQLIIREKSQACFWFSLVMEV